MAKDNIVTIDVLNTGFDTECNLYNWLGSYQGFGDTQPTHFDIATLDPDNPSWGSLTLTFTGSGFTYDPLTSRPLAGIVTGMTLHADVPNVDTMVMSYSTGISAATLFKAAIAYQASGLTDQSQLDKLFASVAYIYNGSEDANIFGFGTGPNPRNDTIYGNEGVDQLVGGGGDDLIEGGEGADILDGGTNGKLGDTLSYVDSDAGVTVVLGDTGVHTIAHGGKAEGDDIVNFENISGGDGDDDLSGNSGINIIKGGDGNDTISGGAAADILDGEDGFDMLDYSDITDPAIRLTISLGAEDVVTTVKSSGASTAAGDRISNFEGVNGGAGDDILTGNSSNNEFHGGDGHDLMSGGFGSDILDGGLGFVDTLTYATSAAAVNVSLAANSASGGDAEGDIIGNFENLIGSRFGDILEGTDENNLLNGGVGIDSISYANAGASVTVTLGVSGTQNTIGAGIDTLISFENLIGSDFADHLTGSKSVNVIDGGGSADIIKGGGGADRLTGGGGDDHFVFATKDSPIGKSVTITDFSSGHDMIDLSAIDPSKDVGDQQLAFGGQNSNVVARSVTWFEDGAGHTIVQADATGDTKADIVIVLDGTGLNLQQTDFLL